MPSIGTYKSSVNKSAKSFRTTIPLPVANALALSNKDLLTWEINIDENHDIFIIVRASKNRGTRKD